MVEYAAACGSSKAAAKSSSEISCKCIGSSKQREGCVHVCNPVQPAECRMIRMDSVDMWQARYGWHSSGWDNERLGKGSA